MEVDDRGRRDALTGDRQQVAAGIVCVPRDAVRGGRVDRRLEAAELVVDIGDLVRLRDRSHLRRR
jgi:hypothetical protein